MNMFRTLRADEIDCRIAQIKSGKDNNGKVIPKGLSLLLYKDARCDQNILDETVGPMNWERKHSRENANCTVSIWDKDNQRWVSKEDTGTESNTEKEKGLASDSFKRACFNWGIGRELYSAPFIWVNASDCNIVGTEGKYKCFDNFTVKEIAYNGGNIVGLKIKNSRTNKIVFSWKDTEEKPEKPDNEPEPEKSGGKVEMTTIPSAPEPTPIRPARPDVNTPKGYMLNEMNFMGRKLELDAKAMSARFESMRKTLIANGMIEDIKADEMTMEQAKKLIELMHSEFLDAEQTA